MTKEFTNWLHNIVLAEKLRNEIKSLEDEQNHIDSLTDSVHGDNELEETFIKIYNVYTRKIKIAKYRLAKVNLEIAQFEYEECIRD